MTPLIRAFGAGKHILERVSPIEYLTILKRVLRFAL